MAAGILVWSECPALALELLGKARRLADAAAGEVSLCISGDVGAAELEVYAANGADVVYVTETSEVDAARWASVLGVVIARSRPSLVLIGATKAGLEVAPRVAERTEAAYAAWAVAIEIDPTTGATTASCMVYAGAGVVKYRFSRGVTVLSAAQGAFEASELEGRAARAESVVLPNEMPEITVLSQRTKATGGARLEEAKTVVDIGRGVKELDDLEMIRSLMSLLDAQLGCSRPVSSDRDWLPEWLGLSGVKVKPELCLTIGLSGAIQHMVGIRDSRVVAAVDNDQDAAIFTQADIGVVADLNEFLPVLIERLQARGARPIWV